MLSMTLLRPWLLFFASYEHTLWPLKGNENTTNVMGPAFLCIISEFLFKLVLKHLSHKSINQPKQNSVDLTSNF